MVAALQAMLMILASTSLLFQSAHWSSRQKAMDEDVRVHHYGLMVDAIQFFVKASSQKARQQFTDCTALQMVCSVC